MPPEEQFAKNLRKCRVAAEITQEELAKRAGVHAVEIGQFETGKRTPRVGMLVKLASALEAQPADLLEGMMPVATER